MVLGIRQLQLNVVCEIILVSEIVGLETAVLLSRAFYFFRRVAGNGHFDKLSAGCKRCASSVVILVFGMAGFLFCVFEDTASCS